MGALSPFGIGRRPVLDRVLVLYRVLPEGLAACLPPGVRPRTRDGQAVLALCYTRLGQVESRWIPHRLAAPSDHVDYRVFCDFEAPAGGQDAGGSVPGAWVLRRTTSSRFEAQCGARLQRGEYARGRFDVESHELGIDLRVTGAESEELSLRAHAAPAWSGSLFGTLPDLEAFLADAAEVRPGDLLAPEADDLELGTGACALQPMRLLDVRCPFLERAPGGAPLRAGLEGTVRVSSRRLIPVEAPERERRVRTAPAGAMPAL